MNEMSCRVVSLVCYSLLAFVSLVSQPSFQAFRFFVGAAAVVVAVANYLALINHRPKGPVAAYLVPPMRLSLPHCEFELKGKYRPKQFQIGSDPSLPTRLHRRG